jgi:hypothetical protein
LRLSLEGPFAGGPAAGVVLEEQAVEGLEHNLLLARSQAAHRFEREPEPFIRATHLAKREVPRWPTFCMLDWRFSVWVEFSPNPMAAPGSGSSQLDVTPFATATSGTFSVTVTGTGGGNTHSATLTLIVKPNPTCLGPVVLPTPTPTPTPTPKAGR